MTVIQCSRCSTEFDAEDGATARSDVTRCPSCGEKHELPAADGGTADGADSVHVAAADEPVALEVHVHVHRHD